MKIPTKTLPAQPGVYLFKDSSQTILYVGKAKNLKKRVASYFQKSENNLKAQLIVSASTQIEHIVTKNEVEAMLLEAQLIRNYQPKFNILLKFGQPYLYIFFSNTNLPELKLVRTKKQTKKQSGTYFGPFLEKGPARRAYNFLQKTFQLKLCNKKIPNGCLHYHIGKCAGSCKNNFDKERYVDRLNLAKQFLQKGHKKFLKYLEDKIEQENKKLNFEKSKEYHDYYQAFERVFLSLKTNFSSKEKALSHKHIWILSPNKNFIFLFDEHNGITKKKLEQDLKEKFSHIEYIESFYRAHDCPQIIVNNFIFENHEVFEKFLEKWHEKSYPVKIFQNPNTGHLSNLLQVAKTHAQEEIKKMGTLASSLKKLLKLSVEPHTIDCFDISHVQGHDMVGSCVRFTDGKPDKNYFRKFKIKTVDQQDDYACLREIVQRRYRDTSDLPDLIVIDGGKGQLNAVQDLFPKTEFVSLAKKEEVIFSKRLPDGKKLALSNFSGQTLVAIRDYAHHFAISYHKKLQILRFL